MCVPAVLLRKAFFLCNFLQPHLVQPLLVQDFMMLAIVLSTCPLTLTSPALHAIFAPLGGVWHGLKVLLVGRPQRRVSLTQLLKPLVVQGLMMLAIFLVVHPPPLTSPALRSTVAPVCAVRQRLTGLPAPLGSLAQRLSLQVGRAADPSSSQAIRLHPAAWLGAAARYVADPAAVQPTGATRRAKVIAFGLAPGLTLATCGKGKHQVSREVWEAA